MNATGAPRKQGRAGIHRTTIVLHRRPGTRAEGVLVLGGQSFRCAIGRSGIGALKREGDGATPRARLRCLGVLFRPGRVPPPRTLLPLGRIGARDGWCDAVFDPNYNRPVRLPYARSHEAMARADALYDIVVVLDWNLTRRLQGRGSAIFLHLARPGFKPTEGCVAVTPRVMRRLLAGLRPGAVIDIRA